MHASLLITQLEVIFPGALRFPWINNQYRSLLDTWVLRLSWSFCFENFNFLWLSKFRLHIDQTFELIEQIQEEIYFIAECLILRLSPSSKPVFIKYYCNNGYVTNKISSSIFLKNRNMFYGVNLHSWQMLKPCYSLSLVCVNF